MTDEPERDYGVEARMILQGLTGLLVEKRHLEALEEHYQVLLIRAAARMALFEKDILNETI